MGECATYYPTNVRNVFVLFTKTISASDEKIISTLEEAMIEAKTATIRYLFYARTVLDARHFFQVCYKWLAQNYTEIARWMMAIIPIACRWDDLFVLFDTPLEKEMANFIGKQLVFDRWKKDVSKLTTLARWMPNDCASTKPLARRFMRATGLNPHGYRKAVLNTRTKLIEIERDEPQHKWLHYDIQRFVKMSEFKQTKVYPIYEAFLKVPIDEDKTIADAPFNSINLE